MFEKCAACNSRIVVGGKSFLGWKFCNEACQTKFKVRMVDRILPAETVEQQVRQLFHAECPVCRQLGPNDLHSATTVTGLVLAFRIARPKKLCCSACGRKHKLLSAVHCLFLGWWSPRAAFVNVFVIPTNLIGSLLVRTPAQPSPALVELVKSQLADSLVPQLQAVVADQEFQQQDR